MSKDPNQKIKPLVTREVQHETNLATGKTDTRLFIKVYFESRDSGLLADIPDDLFKTLIVLGTHMDENGYCFPSQALLAKELGIGRQAVNARIKRLLAYRFNGQPVLGVRKQKNGTKGRFSHNGYTVYPITNIAIFDHDKPGNTTVSRQHDTVNTSETAVSRSADTVPTDTADTDTNQNQYLNKKHTQPTVERVSEPSVKKQIAETLIQRFHGEQGRPSEGRKIPHQELKFAQWLHESLGYERADYVITYGLKAAAQTNYDVRFLQGLEQYVPEAIEDFEKAEKRKSRMLADEQRQAVERQERLDEMARHYECPLDERVERRLSMWKTTTTMLKKLEPTETEIQEQRETFRESEIQNEERFREKLKKTG